MKKTTDELLKILNNLERTSDLEHYTETLDKNIVFHNFTDFINFHLAASSLTASDLIQRSEIQRNYGYQILNGTKNPGRNKVIALCLTLKLTLEDTQRGLTLAHENILYPRNKRDSILIFCINKKMSVLDTNELLYNEGEDLL